MTPRPWKRGCNQCAWMGDNVEILTAPNPFDVEDTLQGCPECRSINDFQHLCDKEGCWQPVAAGGPTEEGYKWLCYKHWKQERDKIKKETK